MRIHPRTQLRHPARAAGDLENGENRWLLCLESLNERERTGAEWARTESELRGLLDSLDNGVLVFDETGKIRASNDRFAQIVVLICAWSWRSFAILKNWRRCSPLTLRTVPISSAAGATGGASRTKHLGTKSNSSSPLAKLSNDWSGPCAIRRDAPRLA